MSGSGQLRETGWVVAISVMGRLSVKSSRWSWAEPYQPCTTRLWAQLLLRFLEAGSLFEAKLSATDTKRGIIQSQCVTRTEDNRKNKEKPTLLRREKTFLKQESQK